MNARVRGCSASEIGCVRVHGWLGPSMRMGALRLYVKERRGCRLEGKRQAFATQLFAAHIGDTAQANTIRNRNLRRMWRTHITSTGGGVRPDRELRTAVVGFANAHGTCWAVGLSPKAFRQTSRGHLQNQEKTIEETR